MQQPFIEPLDARRYASADLSKPFDGNIDGPVQLGSTAYFILDDAKTNEGRALFSVNLRTGHRQEILTQDESRSGSPVTGSATLKVVQQRLVVTDDRGSWSLAEGDTAAQQIAVPEPLATRSLSSRANVVFLGSRPVSFLGGADARGQLYTTTGPSGHARLHVAVDLNRLEKHAPIDHVLPWQDRLIITTTNHRMFESDGTQSGTREITGFSGVPVVVGDELVLSRQITKERSEVLVTDSADLKTFRRFQTDGPITHAFWSGDHRALLLMDRWDAELQRVTHSTGVYLDLTARRAALAFDNSWHPHEDDPYNGAPATMAAIHLNGALYVQTREGFFSRIDDADHRVRFIWSVRFSQTIYTDGVSLFGAPHDVGNDVSVAGVAVRYSTRDGRGTESYTFYDQLEGVLFDGVDLYGVTIDHRDRLTRLSF